MLGVVLVVAPALTDANFDTVYEPRTTVEEVVTRTTEGTETRTTTKEADASPLERSLGDGGLVLARIAIVALVAFLAGAMVQRTLLGAYAFKAGGIEVPDLAEAANKTDEALAKLTAGKEPRRLRPV